MGTCIQIAISFASLLLHALAYYFVGSRFMYSLFSEIILRFNDVWIYQQVIL